MNYKKESLKDNVPQNDIEKNINYIENFGNGMKRIQEAYENNDLKPSFNVNNTYFRIILPDLNFHHNSTNDFTIRLSDTQVVILSLIKEKNNITIAELANKLNKEISTIKKSIKTLKNAGLLIRVGTNRLGRWEILENKKD